MSLQDLIASSSAKLVSSSLFAEAVAYTTKAAVSKGTLYANVYRRPIMPLPNAPQIAIDEVLVEIRNADPQDGYKTPALGDKITVAVRYGETPRECRVTEIVDGDVGHWLLRCRP